MSATGHDGDTHLDALRDTLRGAALRRGEPGYADEVAGYNTVSPIDPDLVVGAIDESDVQAAVRFARDRGMRVSVMATGHGSYAPIRDGLLIRTTRMQALEVDAERRRVTVGAGVVWRDVSAALAPHGWVAVSGSSPSVSAVGLALGGGLGPLSRTFGCTVDHVRAFRVVTATGEALAVDEDHHPDLFWGLRGGKVGLGIVTEMTFDVLDLPVVYAGSLFFDSPDLEAVYRGWLDWSAVATTAVNSSVNILRAPDLPGVPEPLRGRTVLHLRYAYADEGLRGAELQRAGEQALGPIRDLATPVLDSIALLSTDRLATIHADPEGPIPVFERGTFLDALDQDFATILLDHFGPHRTAPFIAVETRHFGGAISDDADSTSMGGRSATYGLFLIGAPDPALFDEVLAPIADAALVEVAPWVHAETNYHWAGHPQGEAWARLWSTATAGRLDALRAELDPAGLFAAGFPRRDLAGSSA